MNVSLMKQQSGFIPVAMSLVALALVVGHIAYSASCTKLTRGQQLTSGSCLWLDRCQ
jgi:hypothetical protein